MKRKPKISQISLSYKNKEEIKKLAENLKKNGFKMLHGLDDVNNIKERIVAVVVDNKDRVMFQSCVTCMACWCSAYKMRPLTVSMALENFDKLFIEQDEKFYRKLLKERRKNG